MDPISLHNIQQTVAPTVVGGRLELESSTEIQWKPYYNYSIGLYDGEQWKIVTPSGLVQTFNDFTTISGTSVAVDTNYDVYAKYESQNNFTLEFQEWAGATSRYEDPQRWQGIYVRDLTDEGKKMRWLGTIRMDDDSGAKFKDQMDKRFINNHYNKITKNFGINCPYSSDTSDADIGQTWESWNANSDDFKIQAVCDGINRIKFVASCVAGQSTSTQYVCVGIGMNAKTLSSDCSVSRLLGTGTASINAELSTHYAGIPPLGYNYWYPLQSAQSGYAGQILFYRGTAGTELRASIQGSIIC